MDRLDFLKRCGVVIAGASVGTMAPSMAKAAPKTKKGISKEEILDFPVRSIEAKVDKPITVMIIGAGNRGNTYARYALNYPKAMKVVAVSDINEGRRKKMCAKHNIAPDMAFGDYSEALSRPKLADVVVISTPDNLHYKPCMKALELGYDVLLEKPIAMEEKECRDILAQARRYNRIVAVCHVLRYAPYFEAMKKVISSGMIGDVVNIQHMEPISFDHIAHSYVRGNWHNTSFSAPIILAKSCHDLDIMRWLVDKPCETVAAEGSLYLFRKENAPKGATARCTDGCPHEATCPFSAVDHYVRKHRRLSVFDLPRVDDNLILEKLRTTNYGRCVFHSNNDQCDHYVSTFRFKDGVTGSFTLGMSYFGGRMTRVMGTKGYIEGDMKKFVVYDFVTGTQKVWNKNVNEIPEYKGAGHGGGDHALVRDFIHAVTARDESILSSNIAASVESHVMGFRAEKSRKSMKKMAVKL